MKLVEAACARGNSFVSNFVKENLRRICAVRTILRTATGCELAQDASRFIYTVKSYFYERREFFYC